jgi:hypothetical protein
MLRVPRHDGHDFGLMAGQHSGVMPDSVPMGWRTISLLQRNAVRHVGLVSGMAAPGTERPAPAEST